MKKHLNEDAPRLVVAVPSLQPEFALYNTATGELKRVYGGNVCENSVYTDGIMPKAFRLAAEDESYQNELILSPLPAEIEETVLSESPECKLVITGYKLLEIQEQEEQPGCRVLRHPAAPTPEEQADQLYFDLQVQKLAKKAKRCTAKNQLFLFPEIQPKSISA